MKGAAGALNAAGVAGPAGVGGAGAFDAVMTAEASATHFGGSLFIRPLARNVPQGTHETGVAAQGSVVVGTVNGPVNAPEIGSASVLEPGDAQLTLVGVISSVTPVPGTPTERTTGAGTSPTAMTTDASASSSAHFEGSLPIRWLERPVPQGTPETGEPEAAAASGACATVVAAVPVVAPDQVAEASQSVRFDGSLPVRWLERPVSQGTPETGAAPRESVVAGTAGTAGTAGVPAQVDARLPLADSVPAGPSLVGAPAALTTRTDASTAAPTAGASSSARFDGSLPVRWLERPVAQGTPETGAMHGPTPAQVTVHPTAVIPAGPALTPQPAPAPQTTPTPQPALTAQLATPLFSLASAAPGQHVMTLRVSPEDLGPLTVRAHIDAAGVRIELFAPGDAGRDAVRHILPELRRGLEDSGASLSLSSHNSPQDGGARGDSATGNAPRDAEPQPRRFGDPGANGTEDQPQQRRQPAPGVVHDPGSPSRLDILV
ncbi:flagellar hook-length control protein FliK [Paenarthrobacter sp. NPDC056912]|uniref:flagellar hook-length control protein FliK n=1 Tax=Paenarthrobacter sp. NPDC056912 TaxID=3345965 RepID=UPI00366B3400